MTLIIPDLHFKSGNKMDLFTYHRGFTED